MPAEIRDQLEKIAGEVWDKIDRLAADSTDIDQKVYAQMAPMMRMWFVRGYLAGADDVMEAAKLVTAVALEAQQRA